MWKLKPNEINIDFRLKCPLVFEYIIESGRLPPFRNQQFSDLIILTLSSFEMIRKCKNGY